MLPGTAKEMVERLISADKLTESVIARAIGVQKATISRIRRGYKPSSKTALVLLRFYLKESDAVNT